MDKTGTWDNVDDTILGEDDFQDVKDAVSQLTGMWQGFGSVLGLSPAAIREIHATHPDPARCLDEVLERWLREDYNRNKFPPPSWRQLVCAVQNTNGGKNPALAKRIAPLHPKKKKTSENGFVPCSPNLHPVIVAPTLAPTLAPQVSPRPTTQQSEPSRPLLQQPSNTSKQDTTAVAAQEVTVPSSLHINDSLLSPRKTVTVQSLNDEAPVGNACQETAQLQSPRPMETESETIDHSRPTQIIEPFLLSAGVRGESMDMEDGQKHFEVPGKRKTVNPSIFPHHDKRIGQIDMDGGKLAFDKYDPYQPGSKQELKLSFGTFAPLNKQPDSNFDKYNMERFPHGIALIINNETFDHQKVREGTDLDEGNLVETFRYLGYQVEVHRDKKKAEIETIFDNIKARDHSAYDSFVCCLLTHGADGGYIYASDSLKLELNFLISKLNAASCKSLFGKPKLFFIQACRGKGKSPAVYLERVESDSDTPMVLPNETDFFFGYATTPTMVAWRDLDNGSWYVNELCQTLCEHSSYADLTSMHEIVQRKIAEVYEINDFKQTTENNSRLTRKVYFVNGTA